MKADWPLLIAVMAVSLLITLALVFYADFRGGRDPHPGDSPMDHPLGETLAAYAISLGVSLALLWAFDRTDGVALPAILGMTVLLGLAASLGAAVGRLVLGDGGSEGNGGNEGGNARSEAGS